MPYVLNKRRATQAELADAVYVGRPSKWGNPYSHVPRTLASYRVATRAEAVAHYRRWIDENPARDTLVRQIRRELAGKNLVCWCHAMRMSY